MADDNNTINPLGGLRALDSSLTNLPTEAKKKNEEIGKNEFLQLLVTQLKNQDPLDPMKDEQFAVNLAQFSQLEQLVSINDKIGAQPQDLGSMAAYLGQQVTLDSDTIHFENGEGGLLRLDLPVEAANVEVQLLREDGSVADVIPVGALPQGKQTIELGGPLNTSGDFKYRVVATDLNGGKFDVSSKVAGLVTGFIPGPEPLLLLGSREISPSEVLEVNLLGS